MRMLYNKEVEVNIQYLQGRNGNVDLPGFIKNWEGRIKSPLIHNASGNSVSEKIWNIFSDSMICKNKPWELDEDATFSYIKKIKAAVTTDKPIPLVFIAFPFKANMNFMVTDRKYPDMGEFMFLVRLLRINATISQIYPPGVKWTILTEGRAYAPILGVKTKEVDRYLHTINFFVKLLLGGATNVEFLDLQSLCENAHIFSKNYHIAIEKLKKEGRKGIENMGALGRGVLKTMFWSVSTEGYSVENVQSVYRGQNLSPAENTLKMVLLEKALEASIKYLAHNQARYKARVPQQLFPASIYASVTHKPGRYAFWPIKSGSLRLPHHGVPVLSSRGWKDIKILHLDSVNMDGRIEAIHIEKDFEKKPFFYRYKKASKKSRPVERVSVYGIY